jgi:hypothetical protein
MGLALLVLGVLALFGGLRFLWALRGFVLVPLILIIVGLVLLRIQRR